MSLGMWGYWFYNQFLSSAPTKPADKLIASQTQIAIACFVTVIALLAALWRSRSISALRTRGQLSTATVTHLSLTSKYATRNVTFAFEYNNRTYTFRQGIPAPFADNWTEDTTLPVLFDPKHPGRAYAIADASSAAPR